MTQPIRRPRSKSAQPRPRQIETRLTKSPQCVAIHADGVWGGLTPKAHIVMGFFTEQFEPPDRITYDLPAILPASLTETSRQGGGWVNRELQAQVFLSAPVARSLMGWLKDKIDALDAVIEAQKDATANDDSAGATLIIEADKE